MHAPRQRAAGVARGAVQRVRQAALRELLADAARAFQARRALRRERGAHRVAIERDVQAHHVHAAVRVPARELDAGHDGEARRGEQAGVGVGDVVVGDRQHLHAGLARGGDELRGREPPVGRGAVGVEIGVHGGSGEPSLRIRTPPEDAGAFGCILAR